MLFFVLGVSLLLCVEVRSQAVAIQTEPTDADVCVGADATFTCVVRDNTTGSIVTSGGWHVFSAEISNYVSVDGRDRHTTSNSRSGNLVTSTLTVTDVMISDNGSQYRCQPVNGVNSNTVTLTVTAFPGRPTTTRFQHDPNTNNTLMFCWTPLANTDTYNVIIKNSNDVVVIMMSGVAGTMDNNMLCQSVTNETQIFGNETYSIVISGTNGCGVGPTSLVVMANAIDNGGGSRSSGDGGSLPGGAIAGIIIGVLGGLVLVIVIIVIIIFVYKKKSSSNPAPSKLQSSPTTASPQPGVEYAAIQTVTQTTTQQENISKPKRKETKPPKEKKSKGKDKVQPEKTAAGQVQYAQVEVGTATTSNKPVDNTKVTYGQVKESEPLSYAKLSHDPESGEKPVQGRAPVEYSSLAQQ